MLVFSSTITFEQTTLLQRRKDVNATIQDEDKYVFDLKPFPKSTRHKDIIIEVHIKFYFSLLLLLSNVIYK